MRKIFFSFHYERDSWRAGQVRNSGIVKGSENAGFIDAVDWEKIEKEGDASIARWINSQLDGTSVTVVLIGKETVNRRWVKYEIEQSYKKGNALIGVYIHNLKNQDGETDYKGANPFDFKINDVLLSDFVPLYDWVNDCGYDNFGDWVEDAYNEQI